MTLGCIRDETRLGCNTALAVIDKPISKDGVHSETSGLDPKNSILQIHGGNDSQSTHQVVPSARGPWSAPSFQIWRNLRFKLRFDDDALNPRHSFLIKLKRSLSLWALNRILIHRRGSGVVSDPMRILLPGLLLLSIARYVLGTCN